MPTAAKKDLELSRLLWEVIPPIMYSIRGSIRDFKGSSLTFPQFRVLGLVSIKPCTNKQVADWQGVSLPAMSRMVENLVRRKLLLRTPDSFDRRQVQLQLSGKGKKEFDRLRRAVQATLAERIAVLPTPDKRALAASLTTLKELFK